MRSIEVKAKILLCFFGEYCVYHHAHIVNRPHISHWLLAILVAAGLSFTTIAPAAPLRVTTWDLEPPLAAGTNTASRDNFVKDASDVLTRLHPDVIILQGVPDYQSCADLLKALKPAKYNLAAWSSLRDPETKRLSSRQTAILSKSRAYISWSDAWKNDTAIAAPGGFAFAAIKVSGRGVGFFSVELGNNNSLTDSNRAALQPAMREESARQLLAQIDTLKTWTTNRIQSLIVAGNINTSVEDSARTGEKTIEHLRQSDLADAFGATPLAQRITLPGNPAQPAATFDYIFTRDAKPVQPPEIVSTELTAHLPVTCDLDLEFAPSPPTSPQVAQTPAAPPATPAPKAQAAPAIVPSNIPVAPPLAPIPASDKERFWAISAIALGALVLFALIWKLTRPRTPVKSPLLITVTSTDATAGAQPMTHEQILISPQSAETTGTAADSPPIVHIESPALGDALMWRRRAEEAERRAEQVRAHARQGVMEHLREWLKGKIVQRLATDRAQLLDTQEKAAAKMQVVDQRLAKIESQLQKHTRAYEKRIEELEKELAEAREENRELIRAKITQVKAEMERERAEAARRASQQS